MRLIDADALLAKVGEMPLDWEYGQAVNDIYEIIRNAPTIVAVLVVRCKDCKYYQEGKLLAPNKFCFRLKDGDGNPVGYNFSDDDFCSRGERKENNA